MRRASAVATVDSLGVKKITVNAFKQAISARMPANAMGASTATKRTNPFENIQTFKTKNAKIKL